MAGVSRKHPQPAHAGLQKSLQQEWAFVQWVALGIGDAFGPVEEEIATVFLLELFKVVEDIAPWRTLTCLPLK